MRFAACLCLFIAPHFVNRYLGVVRAVVDAIKTWVLKSTRYETVAERRLQRLSLRVQKLTQLLPGCITVYGLFAKKGPSLTGAHFRYNNAATCTLATPLSYAR